MLFFVSIFFHCCCTEMIKFGLRNLSFYCFRYYNCALYIKLIKNKFNLHPKTVNNFSKF